MTDVEPQDVSEALLTRIQNVVSASPEDIEGGLPEDRFITWVYPGLPFTAKDFEFAQYGVSSLGTTSDDDTSGGEEMRRRLRQANRWSRLANFVPNPSGLFGPEGQQRMFDETAFDQSGSSIVTIYEAVLKFGQVAATPMTDERKQQIEEYRDVLNREIEVDVPGGGTETRVEDSKFLQWYDEYKTEYEDARFEYVDKMIEAQTTDDPAIVSKWSRMQDRYRKRVNDAYQQWVSRGHKYEIERIREYIAATERRNLELLRKDLLEDLRQSRISETDTGLEFVWTSVIPGSFADSNAWTGIELDTKKTKEYSREEREFSEWQGSGGGIFGGIVALKGGGSGEEEIERTYDEVNTDEFKLSFEITQVMISRPWFSPEFVLSNAWRWPPSIPEDLNVALRGKDQLSDGGSPPSGAMVGYPTAAIFIRDVELEMAELREEDSQFRRDVEKEGGGGGGIVLGPIKLGGSASTSTEEGIETEHSTEITNDGTLKIDGMQLIGFRCKLLPELPNPADGIEEWV